MGTRETPGKPRPSTRPLRVPWGTAEDLVWTARGRLGFSAKAAASAKARIAASAKAVELSLACVERAAARGAFAAAPPGRSDPRGPGVR